MPRIPGGRWAGRAALAVCTLAAPLPRAAAQGAETPPTPVQDSPEAVIRRDLDPQGQETRIQDEAAAVAQDPNAQGPNPGTAPVLRLALPEALAIALQNSITLQIEEQETDVSRYVYIGSWGAFDPLLSALASVDDSEFQASSIFQGATVVDQSTQQFAAGLSFPLLTGGSLSFGFDTVNQRTNSSASLADTSTTDVLSVTFLQPLLRGAGTSYATSVQREAEYDWQWQRERNRAVRMDVLLVVENAYWDLVAALEALSVAQVTLDLGNAQLDQNQRRLDAGVGTEVDVLQAQANVAVREQEELSAQNFVRAAADRLKTVLLGNAKQKNWDVDIVPTTPLPESVSAQAPPWEAALAVALESRPELRQARLLIERAEVTLSRSESNTLPQLDLRLSTASTGFDGDPSDAFETAVGWDFPNNSAALEFSFPLGNRIAQNAERIARARLRQTHLIADLRELEITSEVRSTVRQVEFEVENIRASAVSLALAQRQLAAEQARYTEGLTTTFEVLQFQEQLAQALLTEKRARVNYVKSLAALRRAEGLTGERTRP